MTILKSSPDHGSDFSGTWADATRQAVGEAWSRLEDEWRTNVVETTPRWLVTTMVVWAALVAVVLLMITGVTVLAF